MVSNTLTLVFSGIVAISTGVYAILTWRLTSETRKMREAQTTPNVLVTVEQERGTLILIVRNVGLAPAYNVVFRIYPDLEIVRGSYLSTVGFIKNGLSVLAPGQNIKTLLLYKGSEEFKEQINTVLNIEIFYKGMDGKQNTQNYEIDLSQFEGIISSYRSFEDDLLREIGGIREELTKINTHGIRRN
jgi:hypothetical protein